jgi:uncharacterized protein (UPF0276 family)
METRRLGLGVGFDLPWRKEGLGFRPATALPSPQLVSYLVQETYGYLMFSYQPRGCTALELGTYQLAYDRLIDIVPPGTPVALHHTLLNFGATRRYDRTAVYDFTNALHERYRFAWVNEDVGIWSHKGVPMPYPLPPLLISETIERTVDDLIEAKESLHPAIHLEFPGFSAHLTVIVGTLDAYDWFREVVERAGVAATLDIGHLLSYRWMQGHRGEQLYADLERLPLRHCQEIHLSGCEVTDDRFHDLHHGILLDEQLELLDRLIDRCPNLIGVTYEDPALDGAGRLPAAANVNVDRLRRRVARWMH